MVFAFVATFATGVIGYDVWFYAVHRLLHVPCLYKKFHYEHHTFNRPTINEACYASKTENVLSGLGIFLPVVLQSRPSMAGLFAVYVFCFVRGLLRHDARAIWLVGDHHLQHHLDPKRNFSSKYVDFVFGTQ